MIMIITIIDFNSITSTRWLFVWNYNKLQIVLSVFSCYTFSQKGKRGITKSKRIFLFQVKYKNKKQNVFQELWSKKRVVLTKRINNTTWSHAYSIWALVFVFLGRLPVRIIIVLGVRSWQTQSTKTKCKDLVTLVVCQLTTLHQGLIGVCFLCEVTEGIRKQAIRCLKTADYVFCKYSREKKKVVFLDLSWPSIHFLFNYFFITAHAVDKIVCLNPKLALLCSIFIFTKIINHYWMRLSKISWFFF